MTRKGESPREPGWYPHRYGVEGFESYWDGAEWTGDSRAKRPAFALKQALGWVGTGVALGASMVIGTAVVGLGVPILIITLWWFLGFPLPGLRRMERVGSAAVLVVVSTAVMIYALGIYIIQP